MGLGAGIVFSFKVFKDAIWKFYTDDGAFMARGLAFGLLIYSVPFGLLGVSALSYTVASSATAVEWVRGLAGALMPQSQKEFGDFLSSVVDNRGVLGLAGFLTFLFVSSTTFGSVRMVLNKVFRAQEPRGLIHGRAMEVVMMLATSAVLFVIVGVIYWLALVQSFLPGRIAIVSAASTPAAAILLFWFLYRFSPAKAPGAAALLVGAFAGGALFELSKLAFAWYVRVQKSGTLYGALSGLAFFFFWLYYACVVFVMGAEIAWVFENRKRE